MNVLIIDDESDILEIYNDFIEKMLPQSSITKGGSGKEGHSLSLEKKFDLIISDHRMPDVDGVTMLGQICSDKKNVNNSTPMIVMTGFANEVSEQIDENPYLKNITVIEKPIRFSQFKSSVSKVLSDFKMS